MGSNHKIDFKYLLDQMFSGKLSRDEKNDLWDYIHSSFEDSELDLLMQEHWSGLENQDIVADEMQILLIKNQIFSKINQTKKLNKKKSRSFFPRWTNYFMRVAAILFIPLLFGSLFMFYRMNKSVEEIAGSGAMQQVMATPGSRVHFILPDQSEVWLNSGSKLEFPLNLNRLNLRKVKLTGQGYFKIAHNKKHPFIVETERFSILALGTSFDVSNYSEDMQISSTLEEGSIALIGPHETEIARLHPGQKAILEKSTNQMVVRDVETKLSTSWKDGKLIFRNTPLFDVTTQLERWFNCEIHVDSLLLKSKLSYTATIQDETLGEVLKMIEISTAVKTKIEKREVYINRKK